MSMVKLVLNCERANVAWIVLTRVASHMSLLQ